MTLFFSSVDDSHIRLKKLWRLKADLLITFYEITPGGKSTICKQTQEMFRQYKELRGRR